MSVNATREDTDVSRRLLKLALDGEIKDCRRCEGMNKDRVTASAPGYGSLRSPVALVGQSLCQKCMESQVPFTGGSEYRDQATFGVGSDQGQQLGE